MCWSVCVGRTTVTIVTLDLANNDQDQVRLACLGPMPVDCREVPGKVGSLKMCRLIHFITPGVKGKQSDVCNALSRKVHCKSRHGNQFDRATYCKSTAMQCAWDWHLTISNNTDWKKCSGANTPSCQTLKRTWPKCVAPTYQARQGHARGQTLDTKAQENTKRKEPINMPEIKSARHFGLRCLTTSQSYPSTTLGELSNYPK